MIYFDENKEAYMQKETLEGWGKTCIFSCENEVYNDFLKGKYVWQDNELVLNPEWDNILLQQEKDKKIKENDTLRDAALNQGVTYNNVLFDSDTDQKVNLLAMVNIMNDTDTIEWFGKNAGSLICTKQDLINIGTLVSQLHSFCWGLNDKIKKEIRAAKTVEEVKAIEIDYTQDI